MGLVFMEIGMANIILEVVAFGLEANPQSRYQVGKFSILNNTIREFNVLG